MKLIVGLLLLVALIAPGYSQRRCFVCNNCPQPFEDEQNFLQTCDITPAPTTTPDPNTTPTHPNDPILTPSSTTVATSIDPTTTIPATIEPPTTTSTTPATTTTTSTTPATTTSVSNPWDPIPTQPANQKNIETFIQTLRCFRVERVVGQNTFIDRGCTQWVTSRENTCSQIPGATADNCEICNEDECNSGVKIITSFGTILAALLIVLKFY